MPTSPNTAPTAPTAPRRFGALAALLLLLIPLLLAGCAISTIATPVDGTPGATAGAGGCPTDSGLSYPAYSARQMRVAYGVQSLCERGYTGKGQTVVVIDSYGSPTLQQDLDTFSQRFNLPHV